MFWVSPEEREAVEKLAHSDKWDSIRANAYDESRWMPVAECTERRIAYALYEAVQEMQHGNDMLAAMAYGEHRAYADMAAGDIASFEEAEA